MNATNRNNIPDVPMAMLTSLPLTTGHWVQIARRASWQTTRMSLNTFERHGVFEDREAVSLLADRLRDPSQVARARVLPYQLMIAFKSAASAPAPIRDALQDAMELAIANVPSVRGKVWVFPDVSGSMRAPLTGFRQGATSAVTCADVAALVAASMLRKNPNAGVLPFSDDVIDVRLNARDTVMTNAEKLSALPSGGTNCSAAIRALNARGEVGDLLIFVSDNQSWIDRVRSGATETMRQWSIFKQRNPTARLVCVDLQPYGHSQAADRPDLLNVGGFSDSVFELIARFADAGSDARHWTRVIEEVEV